MEKHYNKNHIFLVNGLVELVDSYIKMDEEAFFEKNLRSSDDFFSLIYEGIDYIDHEWLCKMVEYMGNRIDALSKDAPFEASSYECYQKLPELYCLNLADSIAFNFLAEDFIDRACLYKKDNKAFNTVLVKNLTRDIRHLNPRDREICKGVILGKQHFLRRDLENDTFEIEDRYDSYCVENINEDTKRQIISCDYVARIIEKENNKAKNKVAKVTLDLDQEM